MKTSSKLYFNGLQGTTLEPASHNIFTLQ